MVIDPSGKVGIGTTAPIAALHVVDASGMKIDDLTGDANFSLRRDSANYGSVKWDGSGANMRLYTRENNVLYEDTLVLKSGKVGIGTTAPGVRLTIAEAGGAPYIQLHDTSNGNLSDLAGLHQNTLYLGYQQTNLSLRTGSDDRMWIDNSGNIGIGTTAPAGALHLHNSGNAPLILTGATSDFDPTDSSIADLGALLLRSWTMPGAVCYADIVATGEDSNDYPSNIRFWTRSSGTGNDPAERVRIDFSGKVGIGTGQPGHLLELGGGAYCDGTGDWITGSDVNYKKDITDLNDYGLEEILSLRPVRYVHKADQSERVQLGLIAQEVKPVIPEVVDGEEGHMGIGYSKFVPVLINAVKELEARKNTDIEALRAEKDAEMAIKDAEMAIKDAEMAIKDAEMAIKDAEIEALKRQNAEIMSRLEALEAR